MIKYIGSKRILVPVIEQLVRQLPVNRACDMFAGTTRVGQALRRSGIKVKSNDLASYSEALALAYIVASKKVNRERISTLIWYLNELKGERGYFTETFCIRSRFFQPFNGMRIDAIRNEIDRLNLSPVERGILLTSLLEAADRVDNTCGLQMAYLKKWAPRSFNKIELREPNRVRGPSGTVSCVDANALAGKLNGIDLVYIDPPYNQHSYFSNYHIWETLVRWDAPEVYGVACKRVDCKTIKSDYNSKRKARDAFSSLIERLETPWIIVSFNNEGYHDLEDVAALLSTKGYMRSIGIDFKRYVGAQIGIFNPSGHKVGQVSHLKNKELLFVVGPDESIIEKAISGLDINA
jgi:adenine-specific DNA-methyltransferase